MIRITLRAIGLTAILSALILSLNLIVGAQQAKRFNPPPDKSGQSEREKRPKGHRHDVNRQDMNKIIAIPAALCPL